MLNSQTEVRNNSAGQVVSYLLENYRQFLSLLLEILKQRSSCQMEVLQAIMDCARSGEPSTELSSLLCLVGVISRTSFASDMQSRLGTSATKFFPRLHMYS